eukprot:2256905-Alexandrium_andersonii.AAC.1
MCIRDRRRQRGPEARARWRRHGDRRGPGGAKPAEKRLPARWGPPPDRAARGSRKAPNPRGRSGPAAKPRGEPA